MQKKDQVTQSISMDDDDDFDSETNVEFVTRIMENSRAGPLMQAFVIQALATFSKRVAESTPEKLDTPMISGAAWHKCGVELNKEFNLKYGADDVQRLKMLTETEAT